MSADRLYLPLGSAAGNGYALEVTPATAGWGYASLRVLELAAGDGHELGTGDEEMVLLPLSGSCRVSCDGEVYELAGRDSVFSAVSDCAYLPRDATVAIGSPGGGRFALAGARCERRLAPRYRPASAVPVELRGAGSCSRQVNNFCAADSFEADRLIAVEVLTPAGNWSSYPPHKHDQDRPGVESALEEIYYFEVAPGHAGPRGATGSGGAPGPHGAAGPGGGAGAGSGFGLHRVYGTVDRPIDVLAEVRTGDAVLVPHGWHGPSVAAPGYHLYYLNVMAGPGAGRAWLTCDDPAHAWVRSTWDTTPVDPRLPLSTAPVLTTAPAPTTAPAVSTATPKEAHR